MTPDRKKEELDGSQTPSPADNDNDKLGDQQNTQANQKQADADTSFFGARAGADTPYVEGVPSY